MKPSKKNTRWIEPRFVAVIPEALDDGVLYVSTEYGIMMHRCVCGCRNTVSTPLSPADWQFTYNGETVSVHPSIGNWEYPCRSHYWIRNSRIIWAEDWSDKQIKANRLAMRTTEANAEKDIAEPYVRGNLQKTIRRRWWRRLIPW